jgi:hypothetical protein
MGITIATASGWAIFPIEEWPIRQTIQSSIFVVFLFMGLPAISWEWLCRKTPRPTKRFDSVNSSFLRCMFLYLWAFLLGQSVFSSFAGQMWSNGDAPITPEMKVMYIKHGTANFGAVLFASTVFVMYDHWRASRSQTTTEQ